MSGIFIMGAVLLSLLIGIAWGAFMAANAAGRTAQTSPGTAGDKAAEKPRKKRLTASKLIAMGVLAMDASATYFVLYLCRLSIARAFTGSLPYLTTLIGALQAATAYVLGHYFKKSTAENTKGGITYDAALGTAQAAVSEPDAASIFDTV